MEDYVIPTEREVAEWPGVTVSFDNTKRHRVAVLAFNGRTRRVVFAATPSDNARGLLNHIGEVRKELRGLGASRRKQQPSPHRDRQRNKPVRLLTVETHPAVTLSEPQTGLAKLKGMVMATVAQIAPSGKAPAGTVHWLNECIARSASGVFSEVATVSPGLAAELLRRNEHNRGIKQLKATQYAADMRGNRWAFNGEPIIISDTGELNDGQHRMQAIIDANLSLPFLFVFGVARASRETVDQGAARGASDYLGMAGTENASSSATIARLLLAYEANKGQSVDTREITNTQVVARVRNDDNIAAAAHFAVSKGRHGKQYVAGTLIGFCYYLFSEIDEADAAEFLTQVCTGADLKPGCPAIAVRERLLAVGKGRQAKAAILFRGWNFYRRGMKVRSNSLPATMPLPALI